MIIIKHLCKAFGSHVIFDDFNLTIDDGDFVVFSGVSGCGKTTLLNLIGGLEAPDSGEITVDGTDITKIRRKLNYYKYKVGFLFQSFALIDNKTVLENLQIVKSNAKSGTTVGEALEAVGLSGKENSKIYTLSGGEQQRVALARLMIKKCDIILADEPTGSLDRENADAVMNILKNMNQQGKTIIVVTHDESYKSFGNKNIELKKAVLP